VIETSGLDRNAKQRHRRGRLVSRRCGKVERSGLNTGVHDGSTPADGLSRDHSGSFGAGQMRGWLMAESRQGKKLEGWQSGEGKSSRAGFKFETFAKGFFVGAR